jgi:membrane-associated HD superfamily phosphohydrolase
MISGAVMKDPTLRLKIIEHPLTMIIAIVLITIGYSKAKKIENARKANQTVVIFYIIGLILILARIPWSTWSLFA